MTQSTRWRKRLRWIPTYRWSERLRWIPATRWRERLRWIPAARWSERLPRIPTAHRCVFGLVACLLAAAALSLAAELPPDELQIQLNSYFDSFGVDVVYPTVSVTKRVSASTGVSGRVLVDAITAASIQSRFHVDGVTSATKTSHGGAGSGFDELRTEVGIGATELLGGQTLSLDVLHSREHDYISTTALVAGSFPFAKRNTELRTSLARSWDEVFPKTRTWRKDKGVTTLSAGLTQVLHPKAIAQLDLSYSAMDGMLTDVYQVVTVVDPERQESHYYEPRHPDQRIRRAVGVRANWRATERSSVQIGYRRYWDSWSVESDTFHGLYRIHLLERRTTLGLGLRVYNQGRASFFEPSYDGPQTYMSVDSKLDSGHTVEYQVQGTFQGSLIGGFLDDERIEITTHLNYYRRHTSTPDWHSRSRDLDAIVSGLGFRYRL